jgi:GTPase SAR1 family protein
MLSDVSPCLQDNIMMDTYTATIGVDFKVKTLHIDGQAIRLQIWDTGAPRAPPHRAHA